MTSTAAARLPVIRALLDEARRGRYLSGVLGVRARPEWTGAATFTHEDVPVTVVPCVSTLAVREALLGRGPDRWVVVLTDREEKDLGAGVLTHLVWQRLRTPDPWEAVRHAFSATGLEQALTTGPAARELATGLLQAIPAPEGWPAARGGVLTRDHVFSCVAAAHLGWGGGVADFAGVVSWSTQQDVVARLADLRALAGDPLVEALLEWLASRARVVRSAVRHLLRAGTLPDLVPWGLVVGVLDDARAGGDATEAEVARAALIRAEASIGAPVPPAQALRAWADEAAAVVEDLRRTSDAAVPHLLGRADELLRQVQAEGLAHRSDVLRAGLEGRVVRFADVLRTSAPTERDTARLEAAWADVQAHRLAEDDRRLPVLRAAVRLRRWLAVEEPGLAAPVADLIARHSSSHAWVDAAADDVANGTGLPAVDEAFEVLLRQVRARRAASDAVFAAALAAHTTDDPVRDGNGAHAGVWHVEDLLRDAVLPLAKAADTGVLLLVVDGMSAAVATEVVEDLASRRSSGWAEALLPGQPRRAATLAVLPTLTRVSRTSLLSGQLADGTQADERRAYAELTRAAGLAGAALFHKKPLDSSRLGFAVADDVRAAIADTRGTPLVTCVLNAVDDALDRSDPGGTYWGVDAIKHLQPLLAAAQHAGRVVVLTSDHGHVIERRQGAQRHYPGASSGRSRPADVPAAEGEVLVSGRRVMLHEGRAVLAVDEGVRFGPLKAGYHGGASAAEAVIPVVVLVPGVAPEGTELRLAPPQAPPWWSGVPVPVPAPQVVPAAAPVVEAVLEPTDDGALFGWSAATPAASAPPAGPAEAEAGDLVSRVLASDTWAGQRRLAARVSVTDDQVAALLGPLLQTPARRLPLVAVAGALSVPQGSVVGVLRHVQQLLNVEGYDVLRVDTDGGAVVLDEALLREQFEVAE